MFGGVVLTTCAFFKWGAYGVGGDHAVHYRICDALCKSQKAIAVSIPILGFVGCIIGCAGYACVTTFPGQVKNNIKPSACNFPEYLNFFL